MRGNTVVIYNVFFKKYKAKFSTNFILKKKQKKKHVGKVKAEFSTNSILKKN